MFRIQHLTKSYRIASRRHYVFRNVNLELPEGANIGIIGPNGAGKSTLLRIMGGIDHPDSGRIETDHSISWPLGLKGGFVGHISGRENCRMVCNLYDLRPTEIRSKLEKIKELSGIGDYFEEPVKYYSSGMSSRLGFALSMAFDFEYFLIDEITAVGDAQFKALAKDALREKAKRSKVIMVSHNMSDIRNFCDAGIVIKNGRLTLYEDLEEAIEAYLPKSEYDPEADELLRHKQGLDALRLDEEDEETADLRRMAANHLESIEDKLRRGEPQTNLGDDEFYFQMGRLYLITSQPQKAYEAFEKALTFNQTRADIYLQIALTADRAGRPNRTRQSLHSLMRLDPKNPRGNALLAQRYFEAGDMTRALQRQLRVVRGTPRNAQGWFQLGMIYNAMEQKDDAMDAFIKAIQIKGDNPMYYHQLSEHLFSIGAVEPALQARLKESLHRDGRQRQKDTIKNILSSAEMLDEAIGEPLPQ